MTDKSDEFSILDTLDDILRQLHAFQSRVTDAEAISHAAALALEQLPEPSVNDEHRLEVARARSLAASAAAITRELLDELAALIASLEVHQDEENENP